MESFQERTEEPSTKRLKEAKKEGNTPFSEDFFRTSYLLCSLLLLWSLSSIFCTRFEELFSFKHLNSVEPLDAMKDLFMPFVWPLISLMMVLFLLHFALPFLQRGFLFVNRSKQGNKALPRPKRGYLFPGLFFLLKGLLMLLILVLFLKTSTFHFFTLFFFAFFTLLALFVCGLGDFFYQKFQWKKSMRMTKEEIKEERKENEGNRGLRR